MYKKRGDKNAFSRKRVISIYPQGLAGLSSANSDDFSKNAKKIKKYQRA